MSDEARGWKQAKTKSVDGNKTLPHNMEAEQGVLGSMFISSDAISECAEKIAPEYFYVPAHKTVFSHMLAAWHKGLKLDLITFTHELREASVLDSIGGASFITSLYTFVPTAANLGQYIAILRDKYLLRQVIEVCKTGATKAFEQVEDVQELVSEVREQICLIERDPKWNPQRSTKQKIGAVIEKMDSPEKFFGISTGLKPLDAVIGGYTEGANVVIAGKTSCGKSSLVQLMANEIAVTARESVAVFTFEMTDEQYLQRIVQIRSEVSTRKIANGEAEMQERKDFLDAAIEVGEAPLHVCSDRLDISGIRGRCMQWGPRLCVIDYLQIIPEKRSKGESRTERFDRMSADLKQMALEFNMTTIILSQLSKEDTTYGSSMMTNDSDILLIVETVGEYDLSKLTEDKVITVAKQREGARPKIHLSFVKAITKFKQRKA